MALKDIYNLQNFHLYVVNVSLNSCWENTVVGINSCLSNKNSVSFFLFHSGD